MPFPDYIDDSDEVKKYIMEQMIKNKSPALDPAPVEQPDMPPVRDMQSIKPPMPPAPPKGPAMPGPNEEDNSDEGPTPLLPQKNYGFDKSMDLDALKNAQGEAADKMRSANMGSAFDQIGRSIAGATAPADNSYWDAKRAEAGNPVKNLIQQRLGKTDDMKVAREGALEDPSSPQSKAFQDTIRRLYPNKFSEDQISQMSVKDKDSVFEPLKLSETIEARREATKERLEAAKFKQQELGIRSRETSDAKATKDQQHNFEKVQGLLATARGEKATQQAESDLYAVKKVDDLANEHGGDLNKLDNQQLALLRGEVAKIAIGGVPTHEEMKALDSGALTGRLAGVWQSISNKPEPANAADFVKTYLSYVGSVKKSAQQQIEDRYGRILRSNKAHLSDGDYGSLEDEYLNRFKSKGSDLPPKSPGNQNAVPSVPPGMKAQKNKVTGEIRFVPM